MKNVLIKGSGIIPTEKGYINGIGRSNVELIKNITELNDPDIKFSVYCTTIKSLSFDCYGWPVEYHSYPLPHKLSSKLYLESWYRRVCLKPDLLHLTENFDQVNRKESFVVTIHDMWQYGEDGPTQMFDKVAQLSKAIVTCSEFTKNNIIENTHVSPDKVTVIPWGISHDTFYPRSQIEVEKCKKKYGIETSKYFFSCSCSTPRKNAKFVVAAFREFVRDKEDVCLVMAWGNPPPEILREYKGEIAIGRLKFLQFVSDEDLATLYTGALASFYVSSFEGFGFPLLESMACGTPVVTCDNSSLREIGSNNVYYVLEKQVDEILDSMDYFYKNSLDNQNLIDYAKTFSWHNTALKYIDFYKSVLF